MTNSPDVELRKDAAAELFYTFDWSDWLGADAEIDAYTITIEGDDAALLYSNDTLTDSNTKVKLLLTGGTLDQRYRITCQITTDEATPQIDERSFYLSIVDR